MAFKVSKLHNFVFIQEFFKEYDMQFSDSVIRSS